MDSFLKILGLIISAPLFVELVRYFFFTSTVKLRHEIGSPISYNIQNKKHFFTHLSIRNIGNKTATNISVIIDNNTLTNVDVEIKSNGISTKVPGNDKTIFKFERLLKNDKIEFVFRKEDTQFEAGSIVIQSNETESELEKPKKEIETSAFLGNLFVAFATAIGSYSVGHTFFTQQTTSVLPQVIFEKSDSEKAKISYFLDKTSIKAGDSSHLKITVKNTTNELISNVTLRSDISGSNFSIKEEKNFLRPNEEFSIEKDIPSEVTTTLPVGTHTLKFVVFGDQLGKSLMSISFGKLIVHE